MRLRFWLAAMDAIAWCGGFGSRAYLFAVARAGAAVWPTVSDAGPKGGG
jgi:hypothetical protein